MSYDINLCDPVTHDIIEFDSPHQMKGGTYCVGGTTEAHLNITITTGRFIVKSLGKRVSELSMA